MTLPLQSELKSLLGIFFFFLSPLLGYGQTIALEAETATRNNVSVLTAIPGYTGTGYVGNFDPAGASLTFSFTAPAGVHELTIRYSAPHGQKGFDLQVNTETTTGTFPQTGNVFSTVRAGTYLLQEGQNTIRIGRGWGWFYVDNISLVPATPAAPAKPPKQLVNPNASASARALHAFLVDIYGTKVLSGQQEESEINYIIQQTGKEPAVGAFDLMEYSPSRIAFGANPRQYTEDVIAWAQRGNGRGIVSMAWHWNAPTDLINQAPDKLWWSGFYTRATTFDLALALADKNSERYKLLLRDIDAIAVQLKKFQEADVPVLWRPLHEAAGGWFWWGAKGKDPFIELWRITYDRLTNHHNLNNLIWVFTTEDQKPEWYPGDAYVDVVGIDIYENNTPYASSMSRQWSDLQGLFGGKKLVALSETGNVPSPEKIRGFQTWWSWFALWTGDFIRNEPLEMLRHVYHHQDILTRDELPNWRAGETVTGSRQPLPAPGTRVRVYPNPAAGSNLQVRIESGKDQRATFTLTNLVGVRQMVPAQYNLRGGVSQVQVPLDNVANGLYLLVVETEREKITQKVCVHQ